MKLFKSLVTILMILHFAIAGIHIFVKNHGYDQIRYFTGKYIDPFFIQEWEMFAPPPQSNTKLFYRYLILHEDGSNDTTGYQEILEPLHQKQKNDVYSLARLSYYLFNCSQNLLSQCYEFVSNLPDDIDPCDTILVEDRFHERIQKSFSFKSIARHANLIFAHNYTLGSQDKLLFSFHLLEEAIIPYGEDATDRASGDGMVAYNSGFYPLNF